MRLEVSETVKSSDQEMVLRTLEMCSRDVSSDVVRDGDQLKVYGLGPSPRSKNRHDMTVFHVNAADDTTVIRGDVNFQASAFLGDQPQDEVVRAKLDRLFDQVKTQIGFYAMPSVAPRGMSSAAALSMADSSLTENSIPAEEVPVQAEVVAAAETSTTSEVEAVELQQEPEPVAAEPVPAPVEAVPMPKPAALEEPTWSVPFEKAGQEFGADLDGRKHLAGWMAGLVALLLLVPGGYFFFHRYREQISTPVQTQPSTVVPPVSLPVNAAGNQSQPAALPASSEQAPDPRVWLQGWASAMGTRDASAQAAFYADTVEFYMGQHNVSRDVVMRDRAATMNMRKAPWTVRIQQISVLPQTDSDVKVRLVKHFVEEPEDEDLEWFVPSELELKRINGDWKITSERDLSRTPGRPDPSLTFPASNNGAGN